MIERKNKLNKQKNKITKFKNNILKSFVIISSTIGLLFILGSIFIFQNDPRGTQFLFNKIHRMYGVGNLQYIPEIVGYKLKSLIFKPNIDQIDISMKHIDVQKIEFMRQQYIDAPTLLLKQYVKNNKINKYVPIKISHNRDSKIKAKVRLKGDRDIHYLSFEDVSLRLKLKNNTIMGMKNFSIQRPRTRNYVHEWVLLQMMREEGIVTPRYEFVNVIFNGKNRGLFNIEEHYTKYLIENNQGRDGPIIRFKESPDSSENYKLAVIEAFEAEEWYTEERLPVLEKAINLLKSFQKDELSIEQVFDLEKMATFFALNDLNSTIHGVIPKSMRFYYNPITSRLEPIPFDGHRGTENKAPNYSIVAELGLKTDGWAYELFGNWFRTFFNNDKTYNEEFYSLYISELKRFSNTDYLDNFFENNHESIENLLLAIYSTIPLNDNVFSFGPFPYYFDKNSYYQTQELIRSIIKDNYIEAYQAGESEDQVFIDIRNKNLILPYQIVGLEIGNELINITDTASNVILVNELIQNPRNVKRFYFDKLNTKRSENLLLFKILYKYPGQDQIFSSEVYPYKERVDNFALDPIRMKGNVNEFPFIDVDDVKRIVSIKSGKYSINKPLIIPDGYIFIIQKGVEIFLKDDASIISHSPLEWHGTSDDPIKIIGSVDNNSDSYKKGGGVLVLNTAQSSNLSYVEFLRLSNPQFDSWSVSGAVTFYRSDAHMKNILIANNSSEDGLNMFNSKLIISDSEFVSTKSDALDIDYDSAEILKTTFRNIGNDAIDISGAEIFVNDVYMEKIGDKGISAGENTTFVGSDISINMAEIGVTSKDSSIVTLTDVNLSNVKLAYTAFQKKSEYGPATIIIKLGQSSDHKLLHLIETDSVLYLNENNIVGSVNDVKDKLYGVEYGTKTIK